MGKGEAARKKREKAARENREGADVHVGRGGSGGGVDGNRQDAPIEVGFDARLYTWISSVLLLVLLIAGCVAGLWMLLSPEHGSLTRLGGGAIIWAILGAMVKIHRNWTKLQR